MRFRPWVVPAFLILGTWTAGRCADKVLLRTGESSYGFNELTRRGSASYAAYTRDVLDPPSMGMKVELHVGGPVQYWLRRTRMRGPTRMVMQKDGNLCIYVIGNDGLVWNSRSRGKGCQLVFKDDGNLVVMDQRGRVVWQAPRDHEDFD